MTRFKEESVLALAILFFLFLIFLLYPEFPITGRAVDDASIAASLHTASGLTIDDVLTQFNTQTYQTTFRSGDTIGCIATLPSNTTFFFAFYRPRDIPSQPSVSPPPNATVCTPLNGASQTCYTSSPVLSPDPGFWRCEIRLPNATRYTAPQPLEMLNDAPLFSGTFSPLTLLEDGTSPDNSTLDISTYFSDPEGQPLQYFIKPTEHIQASVSADGIVIFTNPANFSGTEAFYFAASDQYNITYSPPLLVTIGTPSPVSPAPANASACAPLWDCTEWGACTDSIHYRTCTDRNSCSVSEGKPPEEQACTAVETTTAANGETQRDLRLGEQELGDIEEKITITPFHITALSIGVLCLLTGGGIILWQKKQQKKSPVQPAVPPTAQTKPTPSPAQPASATQSLTSPQQPPAQQPSSTLQTYTDTMIVVNRKPAAEVRAILEKTGWKKESITPAISRAQLKIFILEKQAQGFPKETIRTTLITKGWDAPTVDQLLQELFPH